MKLYKNFILKIMGCGRGGRLNVNYIARQVRNVKKKKKCHTNCDEVVT